MACAFLHGSINEEAYCRTHAAELLGVKKSKLDGMIATGRADAFEHYEATRVDCDRKWQSRCLVTLGQILVLEESHA